MNKIKKLASLILALVMALALAAPAFADDTIDPAKKTTISVKANEHTYQVYQIFTGDLDAAGEVLGNVKWGVNGTGKVGESVDSDVLTKLQNAGDTDQAKLAVIENYVNLNSTPVATLDKTNLTADVATGYYLIKDLGVMNADGDYETPDNETLSLYVVEVVGPVTITPKDGTVEVDKKIVEGENRVEKNEAAIGDEITYEITGTLPDNYDKFETFYYEFADTLSTGLAFNNDVKVTVNGVEVNYFTVTPDEETDGTQPTNISIKCEDLKAEGATKNTNGTPEIVVTYTATLTKDANVGTVDGNPNTVKLIYSNDPNQSGKGDDGKPDPKNPTGETPEKEVITYTTQVKVTKIDGADKKPLAGAEFTLTGESMNIVLVAQDVFEEDANGTYWKLKNGSYTTEDPNTEGMNTDRYESTTVKYTKKSEVVELKSKDAGVEIKGFVSENGIVTFTGLKSGDYTLSESVTPDGYNTIDDITFKIQFTVTDGTPKFTVVDAKGATFDDTDGVLSTTVENNKGALLPETGGIGTTIFYVVGGVLAAGAVVLLITKRRMSIDKD